MNNREHGNTEPGKSTSPLKDARFMIVSARAEQCSEQHIDCDCCPELSKCRAEFGQAIDRAVDRASFKINDTELEECLKIFKKRVSF